MLAEHSYQLLKTAAVESLERIQEDRARVPDRLKPLLAHIGNHLFDPTLNVDKMKRACGVRDNSVPLQFHSAVCESPHRYIESRRLETGCRLLETTDLRIWQISELLGYSSIQVFSRAFSRWSGQRPTLYRKRARERAGGDQADPASQGENLLMGTEPLRRALAGELPERQARELIEHLVGLYPSCGKSSQPMSALGPAPIQTDDID